LRFAFFKTPNSQAYTNKKLKQYDKCYKTKEIRIRKEKEGKRKKREKREKYFIILLWYRIRLHIEGEKNTRRGD